ncbi:MAG: hypothetical protein IKS65_01290 [Bacteroidales bacterium]|nr:hypothetical protein [Bacteroidales bacterium]
MLKFFKHSYIAQLVVIVLLIVVLWLPVFISQAYEIAVENPITPLYNIIVNICGHSSVVISILAFVVFIVNVLFFNSMLSVNQFVTRNSSIGAFVFVLCMCCIPMQDEYYPFLLASPFIMIAIQTMYLIYQVDRPEMYLMNSGFFIALASMFYFPAIILIFWVLVSISIMDFKELKHYLIPVLGFFFPYFILLVLFYFNHTLVENINTYLLSFNEMGLEKLGVKTADFVVLVIVLALTWLSLMVIMSDKMDNSVATRKKVSETIWLFFFGFVMLFMQKPVMYNGLIFMVLATFVSMVLCYVKKTKIMDIVIVVMMLVIIVNQYLPLFGVVL